VAGAAAAAGAVEVIVACEYRRARAAIKPPQPGTGIRGRFAV
jgi:hypothetical protein